MIEPSEQNQAGYRVMHLSDILDQLPEKDAAFVAVDKDGKETEAKVIQYRELLGEHPTMDIEIGNEAGTHLFVLANGMVCSNSSKHQAGGFAGQKKEFSGYSWIEQFLQSPEIFKDRGALAEAEGTVLDVKKNDLGGHTVSIKVENPESPDGEVIERDILPTLTPTVKPGDKVDPATHLDDGLVDVEDVVKTSGLGEGRLYFVNRLKQLYSDSGQYADRRHLEVLSRGLIDRVKITDPDGAGDYLPGDIVSYNALEASWKPREGTVSLNDPEQGVGKYLEQPVMHYTIGTKLTKRMAGDLKKYGFNDIQVHDQPPGFEPVYIRLREASLKGEPDFIARMAGSYQKRNIQEAAIRGHESNLSHSTHPATRMGMPDFGKDIAETGKY